MLVLSPWAFGGTIPAAVRAMNLAGWSLGVLLLLKLVLDRFGFRTGNRGLVQSRLRRRIVTMLAVISGLIPAYCLVSALNARAAFNPATYRFSERPFIAWLPSSFDRDATWAIAGAMLAAVSTFWAIRHWLLADAVTNAKERQPRGGEPPIGEPAGEAGLPRRMRRLIWILAVNCALLFIVGMAQRTSGTSRLLWLVEPQINKAPSTQFGPWAYRSNAAAYFLLAWPLILGLWWSLRSAIRPAKSRRSARYANYLLPCLVMAAAAPLVSLSRTGLVIGSLSIIAALVVVFFGRHRRPSGQRSLLVMVLAGVFCLAVAAEWASLRARFENDTPDSGRLAIWNSTWKMFRDYPVYGTGPGSFSSVYSLYRSQSDDYWYAQAHNDWLETLATFGIVGSAPFILGLSAIGALAVLGGGRPAGSTFAAMTLLAVGNCLLFALADFPLQIRSVQFLFLFACAALSVTSSRER